MALDGLVVAALTHEFNSIVEFNRIEKIYQPQAGKIIIHLRLSGQNKKLLFSVKGNYPRVHFTDLKKENPASPPNFCMVLRKHLLGGRIVAIQQANFDRIIKFKIESRDELSLIKETELIIEMMGRHSNIILVNARDNTIIDSIKRISVDISRYRQVLPGLQYVMPPSRDKVNPLESNNSGDFANELLRFPQLPIKKALYYAFTGISPLIGREICYMANIDGKILTNNLLDMELEKLYSAFSSIMDKIRTHRFTPSIYINRENGDLIDFSIVPLSHLLPANVKEFASTNEVIDDFYTKKDINERLKQKIHTYRRIVNTNLERLYKKLQNLHQDLSKAANPEEYKIMGDLILANLYQINRGDQFVELENFYQEDQPIIKIKLDKRLTPSQNAQLYYKKYTRYKTASVKINKQLIKSKAEIDYLEQILLAIEHSESLSDLTELRHELIEGNYLRKTSKVKRASNKRSANYRRFQSSEGLDILVGKNNRQNDEITFKIANKEDLWFHAKDIPGSHVILRTNSKNYSDISILEAAQLAAYYSKGRNATKISIDYSKKENVRKPRGAKPGMVIYDNHSTLIVDASKESIKNLCTP